MSIHHPDLEHADDLLYRTAADTIAIETIDFPVDAAKLAEAIEIEVGRQRARHFDALSHAVNFAAWWRARADQAVGEISGEGREP